MKSKPMKTKTKMKLPIKEMICPQGIGIELVDRCHDYKFKKYSREGKAIWECTKCGDRFLERSVSNI